MRLEKKPSSSGRVYTGDDSPRLRRQVTDCYGPTSQRHTHTHRVSTHSSNTLLPPRLSISMAKCRLSSSSSPLARLSSHWLWYKTSAGLSPEVPSPTSASAAQLLWPNKNSPGKKKKKREKCNDCQLGRAIDASVVAADGEGGINKEWGGGELTEAGGKLVQREVPVAIGVEGVKDVLQLLRTEGESAVQPLFLTRHKTQLLRPKTKPPGRQPERSYNNCRRRVKKRCH